MIFEIVNTTITCKEDKKKKIAVFKSLSHNIVMLAENMKYESGKTVKGCEK